MPGVPLFGSHLISLRQMPARGPRHQTSAALLFLCTPLAASVSTATSTLMDAGDQTQVLRFPQEVLSLNFCPGPDKTPFLSCWGNVLLTLFTGDINLNHSRFLTPNTKNVTQCFQVPRKEPVTPDPTLSRKCHLGNMGKSIFSRVAGGESAASCLPGKKVDMWSSVKNNKPEHRKDQSRRNKRASKI